MKPKKVFEHDKIIEVEPNVKPSSAICEYLEAIKKLIEKSPLPIKQNPRGFDLRILIEVCEIPTASTRNSYP